MDVVVTPAQSAQSAGGTWRLEDRLGHVLGTIRQTPWSNEFTVVPEPGARLGGPYIPYPTLDAAMWAIERHLDGACELVSGPEH
ncbi:hypothetical protein [Methylobacterium nigriterrae]|uniref:hypothetical protein n=1 Tax=Methylobacterium nigriterrae TaxID=3127512 RepID=UPI003013966E